MWNTPKYFVAATHQMTAHMMEATPAPTHMIALTRYKPIRRQ
jgi:hypothetical protein